MGLGVSAHADPVPPAIQARYATGIAATEKSDFKGFSACFAPAFIYVDPSGKTVSRSAYLGNIRDNMKETKKAVVKLTFQGVNAHDGVVDVSFDNAMKFTLAEGVATVHEVGVDRWKKIGNMWFVVKTTDKVMDAVVPKAAKGS